MAGQIRRTGGTPFVFDRLETDVGGQVFVPVRALNELRREALERLEEALLAPFRRRPPAGPGPQPAKALAAAGLPPSGAAAGLPPSGAAAGLPPSGAAAGLPPSGAAPSIHALVSGRGQFLQALREEDVAEIQIESDAFSPEAWSRMAERCHGAGKALVLAMPSVWRREAERFFRGCREAFEAAGFDGILVRNLEEAAVLREYSGRTRTPLYGDHSLYLFNRSAGAFLAELGIRRMTYPLELNAGELEDLGGGAELAAYGYLPVMVTAQCVRGTVDRCARESAENRGPGPRESAGRRDPDGARKSGRRGDPDRTWESAETFCLRDRTGRRLPVRACCAFCYNTIYNAEPLCLIGMEAEVRRIRPAALRLCFLDETPEETAAVIRAYADSFLRGRRTEPPVRNYTRGHLRRGVE